MKLPLPTLALAAALALPAAPALAHGGHDHVMGTVKTIAAGTVEVETREGKRVTIALNDKTKYLRGQQGASAADLVVGVRVVVDAGKEDGKQVAREIRLGPAPKANPKP